MQIANANHTTPLLCRMGQTVRVPTTNPGT